MSDRSTRTRNDDVASTAAAAGEQVAALVRFAVMWGDDLPPPGGGHTRERWHTLADVARANISAARVLEAHSDALAILDEAGAAAEPGGWGVFAAEAPDARLEATVLDAGVELHGVKPWCSLAADLDHALVTAHVSGGRQLFAVDLRQSSVQAHPAEGWVARGLRTITSGPVEFDGAWARPVGAPGWYLDRPGFAWGGLGVAACWLGGARGIADAVLAKAAGRRDDLTLAHLGAIDVALHGAGETLDAAAEAVDRGAADGPAGSLLALRVRSVVADAVERVLHAAAHALGPTPLAFDPEHAARVADLSLYVRQHHAERDLATLGATLVENGAAG